ncbi:MAG: glutamate--cysteine ligase [Candidatus Thioglobus sp.]|jgi:glutamate--cysteine ligase
MEMDISDRISLLKPHSKIFESSKMGLEKEGLRVSENGGISQIPHPKILGCPLTHPYITTDFSESLIELITPPLNGCDSVLTFLANTQSYLYHKLPSDQSFWHGSMPCVIRGETYIPIAEYGKSNRAKMKTIYRRGLANRYGSVMQTIAGIHFNYSFSQDFWKKYYSLSSTSQTLREFIDDSYMCMARNALRYGWVIPYLFGASPAVCKSFLKGYHDHSLQEFNISTLFEPYATSLRMGDIGYQNLCGDEAGVKASYNSLGHYIHSLKAGMQNISSEYEKIGLKVNGEYQQLNTNILQIENEYYSSVRPKPSADIDKKPLDALKEDGVAYIELRSIDINPLSPLGIDREQINFLESLLLYCLLEDSPLISTSEQNEIDINDKSVAHEGRKPGLKIIKKGEHITIQEWGKEILEKISHCSTLLSKRHSDDVINIGKRFSDASLTPSETILENMRENNQGFWEYTDTISKKCKDIYLKRKIDDNHFSFLDEQANISCQKVKEIELSDEISFDEFLQNYFDNS